MKNLQIQNPHLDGSSFFLPAGDTAVLLIHGLTATTVEVRPLAEYLNRNGLAVSAPLLPGHGSDPDDLHSVTWLDWANTVEKAYQELADMHSRVFVAGESLGGLLTLHLAARRADIAGILLYAPALTLKGVWQAPLMLPFVKSVPKSHSGQDPDGHLPWQGYTVLSVSAANQLRKLQKTVKKVISNIHQPTLIFQGRLDMRVDPKTAEMVLECISAREKHLIWLEKSGHVILLDIERDIVYQKTLDFISSASG